MNPLPRRRLLRFGALGSFAVGASAAFVLWENHAEQEPPEILRLSAPMPRFILPALAGGPALSSDDLPAVGRPVLLNFFASWCVPCAQEAPVLRDLRDQGVIIWGVAYKDTPEAVSAFLRAHGHPYARVGRDESGEAGKAFELAGVPETFLLDPLGVMRWRWSGGLTGEIVRQSLTPRLKAVS